MTFYEEILRDFQKRKVRYVIVGGIAFNLLGSFRSTSDLDILVDMTDKNLAKIVGILKKYGYHVKQPVDPMGIADRKIRKDWIENKGMKAFNFYRDDGLEVDIIIDSPVSFKMAEKSINLIKTGNLMLPVISIDNLIKMKNGTRREIDRLDLYELKKVKKLRKKI